LFSLPRHRIGVMSDNGIPLFFFNLFCFAIKKKSVYRSTKCERKRLLLCFALHGVFILFGFGIVVCLWLSVNARALTVLFLQYKRLAA
jgi:hypothetical protein